ncbi:hypothetical protein BDZ91DRAFT_852683 [Kalaharituber pfeilii]|nr:hypothetical protein BDZ91DRAFT_852683 [Kalaharituber pfeilii]
MDWDRWDEFIRWILTLSRISSRSEEGDLEGQRESTRKEDPKWVVVSLYKQVAVWEGARWEEEEKKYLGDICNALLALESGSKRKSIQVVDLVGNAAVSRYERKLRIVDAPWGMEENEVVDTVRKQLEVVFGDDLFHVWASNGAHYR